MKRREFISLLGGAAAGWPLAARAQQAAMPLIGWLHSGTPAGNAAQAAAFRDGVREAGYTEGQNVVFEYRWAENQLDRLPALATELARRDVSVIAACGSPAVALAAKSATSSIPIVFENAADPVQLGLVASFAQPGGNVTGVTNISAELTAKRMGLLRELVPAATSIAVLVNPNRPGVEAQEAQAQGAARALGLSLHILKAGSERDLDAAFLTMVQLGAGGLVIAADALFTDRREQIFALARKHSVPTMYEFRYFVADGGLISYGPDNLEAYRRAGTLAGRILRGAKPADLPVMRPTKFELVINMKTAKALGIDVPVSMQLLADEVIE
jgi:putative tryptophan/tyrosine transport system substrate-binding protein